MSATNTALTRFQELLRQLFRLDTADLDFGLYKLLALQRDQVEAFLQDQLPRIVEEAFQAASREQLRGLESALREAKQEAVTALGKDAFEENGALKPELAQTPVGQKYEEARSVFERARRQAESAESVRELVFDHLYAFFSRYYEDGDFIPKRRYGAHETYAVPYNGEEVFFHWATKGMHYAKTGEFFRDYAFLVAPAQAGERLPKLALETNEQDALPNNQSTVAWRVVFRLTEATVPRDNQKGEYRYFFPRPGDVAYDPDARELVIPFEYRLPTQQEIDQYGRNSRAQQQILDTAEPHLLQAARGHDPELAAALEQPSDPNDSSSPTLLARHLKHYTRKQTTDFFIHRDLRGFLMRELEFYIKDQILQVGDIHGDLQAKLRMIDTVRRLALDIIEFLAQLEEVKKRLFEKRKFVLETHYLCPIMHLPREMCPEVFANPAQQQQWADWFGLEQPADEAFAARHPTLVVDTRHFDADFKLRLLAAVADKFGSIEEATDGLCIHGENYQALRLMEPKYRARVKCIYIDPPYNTAEGSIIYKNAYKHSSWVTLMHERLAPMRRLLPAAGIACITIDDNELQRLQPVLDELLGEGNRLATVVIRSNPSGRSTVSGFAVTHEYALFYAADASQPQVGRLRHEERHIGRYDQVDEAGRRFEWENLRKSARGSLRRDRPKQYFPLYYDKRSRKIRVPAMRWDDAAKCWEVQERAGPHEVELYPIDQKGEQRVWSYGLERVRREAGTMVAVRAADRYEVYKRKYLREEGMLPRTWWEKPAYSARDSGVRAVRELFGRVGAFDFPKAPAAVRDAISVALGPEGCQHGSIVLDYFAGSGTTGHAVIVLNRDDGGRRKFILVEMADYFHTVMVPRIAKVMYCPEWKGGKPKDYPDLLPEAPDTWPEWVARTPRLVKLVRIEGYEDALHNMVTEQAWKRAQERAKTMSQFVGDDEYRIRYLVRIPMEASDSMARPEKLAHPFDYKIEILTDGGPKTVTVDVIETFNFLYGIDVDRIERWEHDEREYRAVIGRRRDGSRVLVVWRDMDGLDGEADEIQQAVESERRFLEGKLEEIKAAGLSVDEALINGDCAARGFRSLDPDFKQLMEEPERE